MPISILGGIPFLLSMFGMANSVGPTFINVAQINGKTSIALDGRTVDLSKATVLEEDPHRVVMRPMEAPEAIITMGKGDGGTISIDYKGQHYESLRPEDVSNMIKGNMAQMNAQMEQLRQQIQNMQNNIFGQLKFPALAQGSR
ncbi:hypothetical protein GE061_016712 [Apolygus lucorum]|uniref:Uncharacterized protein n=1 Tax=Apolygus lucorum TaxID=248454 RepID=A0A8S9XI37_APOLU|nr:hypothetical protein GE061_016712 [Apolygus lucorum]